MQFSKSPQPKTDSRTSLIMRSGKNSGTSKSPKHPLSFDIIARKGLQKLVWETSDSAQIPETPDLFCPSMFENLVFLGRIQEGRIAARASYLLTKQDRATQTQHMFFVWFRPMEEMSKIGPKMVRHDFSLLLSRTIKLDFYNCFALGAQYANT